MKDTAGALASLISGESNGEGEQKEGERKDKGETERGEDKGT